MTKVPAKFMSSVDNILVRFEPLIVVINHIALLLSHLYLDFISYYHSVRFLPEILERHADMHGKLQSAP